MNTAHFKTLLEEEKTKLVSELNDMGTQDPHNPGHWLITKPADEENGPDVNDNADIDEEMDARSAEASQLETRLAEVTAALERIEGGTYGVCEISGEAIEEDRLEANPAARTCKNHMHDIVS